MIRRLHVSNFRSLGQNVEMRLGRLTVLVGQNASGKSNVADAVQFIADCVHLGLPWAIAKRHGIQVVRRCRPEGAPHEIVFRLEVALKDGQGEYAFTLTGDNAETYQVKNEWARVVRLGTFPEAKQTFSYFMEGDTWGGNVPELHPHLDSQSLALPLIGGDERFKPLAEALRQIAVYSIYPDALREPKKYDPAKPMERQGTNWVSILRDQPAETWKNDLIEVLHRLTGDITDLRIQPVAGYLTVQFKHGQTWFEAAQESDGTLRVAGMLAALLQRPRPTLIGLEEPELTVHSGALRLLFDYIRQVSDSSEGGQVLLTTHSPDLLDLIDADAVRVVARDRGVTTVGEMDAGQRAVVKQRLLSLGDVLRSEGGLTQSQVSPPSGE